MICGKYSKKDQDTNQSINIELTSCSKHRSYWSPSYFGIVVGHRIALKFDALKMRFRYRLCSARVRMLFHHVSVNRLELKRRRVTDFFSRRASAIAKRCEVRSSIREVCRSSAEVKKRRVETRAESKRFPNFLTKTIKRCKQRGRWRRERDDATRRDASRRDAPRWYFSARGSLFVRWMLIDTAAPARNIETW